MSRSRLTKRCSKCGEEKPLADFHVRNKKTNCPQSQCKECGRRTAADWARNNKEVHNARFFNWYHANRDQNKQARAKANRDNPDRGKGYSRRSYQRCAEKRREERRLYYYQNRDREREKNRDWRIGNPARNAAKAAAYEARKRQAMPAWADKEKILAVYELCERMNRGSKVKYQVDHIYPLCSEVMCGLHVHYNLQVIPARENQIKSNKIIEHDADSGILRDQAAVLR